MKVIPAPNLAKEAHHNQDSSFGNQNGNRNFQSSPIDNHEDQFNGGGSNSVNSGGNGDENDKPKKRTRPVIKIRAERPPKRINSVRAPIKMKAERPNRLQPQVKYVNKNKEASEKYEESSSELDKTFKHREMLQQNQQQQQQLEEERKKSVIPEKYLKSMPPYKTGEQIKSVPFPRFTHTNEEPFNSNDLRHNNQHGQHNSNYQRDDQQNLNQNQQFSQPYNPQHNQNQQFNQHQHNQNQQYNQHQHNQNQQYNQRQQQDQQFNHQQNQQFGNHQHNQRDSHDQRQNFANAKNNDNENFSNNQQEPEVKDFKSVFRKELQPEKEVKNVEKNPSRTTTRTTSGNLEELEKSSYDKQLLKTLKNLMANTAKRHRLNFEDKDEDTVAGSGGNGGSNKKPDDNKSTEKGDDNFMKKRPVEEMVEDYDNGDTVENAEFKKQRAMQQPYQHYSATSQEEPNESGSQEEEQPDLSHENFESERRTGGTYHVNGFDPNYEYIDTNGQDTVNSEVVNDEPHMTEQISPDGKKVKTYVMTGVYRKKVDDIVRNESDNDDYTLSGEESRLVLTHSEPNSQNKTPSTFSLSSTQKSNSTSTENHSTSSPTTITTNATFDQSKSDHVPTLQ